MRQVEAALDRLRNLGGETLVRKMVDAALENAAKRVGVAAAALEAGDLEALAGAAHSLKSSAANLGATELSDLAREIEGLASRPPAADTSRLASLVGRLPGMLAQLRSYLEGRSPRDEEDRGR